MSQSAFETSEQVLKFDPKAKGRSDVTPLDDAGQAIVAQIRTAADLANQDCDRAMSLAHKLSMELRAAEDRTHQLLAEVELWRNRATRAEECFEQFRKRSRTSSSFGDRYPAAKKRYFTARSRVAKGCIVVL